MYFVMFQLPPHDTQEMNIIKASEFNTSNYLNATTAKEYEGTDLTIYEIGAETIRDVKKMTIGFEKVEKLLVVNKTNREVLADAFGDETNDWVGKQVRLDIIKVMFDGQRTNSIALTPVSEKTPQKRKK